MSPALSIFPEHFLPSPLPLPAAPHSLNPGQWGRGGIQAGGDSAVPLQAAVPANCPGGKGMWARPRLRLSALRASHRTQERRVWPSGLVLDRGCRAAVASSHTSPTWPWVGATRASLSSHRARLSAGRMGDTPHAECHWTQGRGHSCRVRPMTVPRDIPGNTPQTAMG